MKNSELVQTILFISSTITTIIAKLQLKLRINESPLFRIIENERFQENLSCNRAILVCKFLYKINNKRIRFIIYNPKQNIWNKVNKSSKIGKL